jgi:hypothetical protein
MVSWFFNQQNYQDGILIMKFKNFYSLVFLGLMSAGINQQVYANENQPYLIKEIKITNIKTVDGSDPIFCRQKLGTGAILKLYADKANDRIHQEIISSTGKIYKTDIPYSDGSKPSGKMIYTDQADGSKHNVTVDGKLLDKSPSGRREGTLTFDNCQAHFKSTPKLQQN